jgi:large repetitive protein
VQPIMVSVDGTQIGGLVSPASASFSSFSIPFSVSSTGAHTITFTGTDPNDKTTFIDGVTLTAAGVGTTTILTSSGSPSLVGANVTFTATVNGSAPTGSVAFTADGTTLSGCGVVALPTGSANAKTATCSTASLVGGTHSIVATYAGDATNSGSTSATLSQMVNSGSPPAALVNPSFEIPALGGGYQYNPSASGIGWTFSSASGIQGNGSAFRAAAAPDGSQTGFVQRTGTISQTLSLTAGSYTLSFQAAQRSCCDVPYVQPIMVSVDGTQIGGLVSPASASFSSFSIPFSVSSTGAHTITFTGTDPNDKTTFVDGVTLTAAGVGTTTILTSSGSPSLVGANVTFTATMNGSAPTGSVAFTADSTTLSGCGAVTLPAGSGNSKIVTCSTSSLSVGTHSIVATYAGDATNSGSTSATLSQVVNSGSPPAALVNPSFEIPALGGGYQYNPSASGIGWTFSSASGIQGNGSAFRAAAAPDGSQTGFVQRTGTISQTLSLTAGSYTLSFQAAQRSCCDVPYVQPIMVSVDGTQIGGLVSPASASFSSFSIPFSVSSTGAHTITFTGTDPNDKTTFIDVVTLQ